ncbi:DUF1932 domain-containing protein [Nocardia sp. NPDC059180]|uniref:NAD(P)-dependent oxidoreductase n=1 Tax=Nocardia sp. NPDC059180 TaxID=3346761 RepID=UPI00367FAF7F
MIVGLLHPGRMGAAVGAQLAKHGHTVLWTPQGRSAETRDRAKGAGLRSVGEISELLGRAQVVIAICPASAAEQVAETVALHRYEGIYVDANAISPSRMRHIHDLFQPLGTPVIDAVISGPPPQGDIRPRIYLAGLPNPAAAVKDLLTSSTLETHILAEDIGAASALKMSVASYLRTTRLLAAVAHALADQHGVTDALIREAEAFGATALSDRGYLPSVAARAWRWEAEMGEIAQTLGAAGLPTSLAKASAELYHLLSTEKDNWSITPEDMFRRLRAPDGNHDGR